MGDVVQRYARTKVALKIPKEDGEKEGKKNKKVLCCLFPENENENHRRVPVSGILEIMS